MNKREMAEITALGLTTARQLETVVHTLVDQILGSFGTLVVTDVQVAKNILRSLNEQLTITDMITLQNAQEKELSDMTQEIEGNIILEE